VKSTRTPTVAPPSPREEYTRAPSAVGSDRAKVARLTPSESVLFTRGDRLLVALLGLAESAHANEARARAGDDDGDPETMVRQDVA